MRNKKLTKKWLASEMDRRVKQMLKLIDQEADSFSKRAEMYYQKRPELVAHVEEFYRLYRTLAERNDYLSADLRKYVPSDIQSHASGISDIASELNSAWPSRPPRAAGFDYFLGSGWSSPDLCQREGDESPYVTDSEAEPESDDLLIKNYPAVVSTNVSDHGMSRRTIEMEIELREMKDKLRALEKDNNNNNNNNTDCWLSRGDKNDYSDLLARIGNYEEELKIANNKLQLSEGKINWLTVQLQKYKQRETSESESSEEENVKMSKTELEIDGDKASPSEMEIDANKASPSELEIDVNKASASELEIDVNQASASELEIDVNQASASELPNEIGVADEESVHDGGKIHPLGEEFSDAKQKRRDLEKEIACLRLENKQAYEKIQDMQNQLDMAQEDIRTWKFKLNIEKKEVNKLQGRIGMLKDSLWNRDHEIRDLKIKAEDLELKIFPERAKLLEERNCLEQQLRELDTHARSLEDEITIAVNAKRESEERLHAEIESLKLEIAKRDDCIQILNQNHEALESERDELKTKIDNLNQNHEALESERDELKTKIDILNQNHEALESERDELKTKIDFLNENREALESERDELETKIDILEQELSCKCDQIVEMEEQLHRLRIEHVELMASAKGAHKTVKEMQARAKELEDEIEMQRTAISEGAEEKREAIRQLCLSLEHYKNEYHKLQQAFMAHKWSQF